MSGAFPPSNANVNVNPAPCRLNQEIVFEKRFIRQNAHPAISFHCQNLLQKTNISIIVNVTMVSERCQNDIRINVTMVSERC